MIATLTAAITARACATTREHLTHETTNVRARPEPTFDHPTFRGGTLRFAATDDRGDAALAVTLAIPEVFPTHDRVLFHGRCAVRGAWYDGYAVLDLDGQDRGDHLVSTKFHVGAGYHLDTPPTVCHLHFDHVVDDIFSPGSHGEPFATACWNGTAIVDGRCAEVPSDEGPALAVHDLTVANGSSYMIVHLDHVLRRSVGRWYARVAADCVDPDGSLRGDYRHVPLEGVIPGVRHVDYVWLFTGSTNAPESCRIHIELEDSYELAHEHVATYCWHGGPTTTTC